MRSEVFVNPDKMPKSRNESQVQSGTLANLHKTLTAPTLSVARSFVDCQLIFPHPSWYWETLLKICVFIFAFILPVLIITVCYGLMILRLKSVRMLSGSQVSCDLK